MSDPLNYREPGVSEPVSPQRHRARSVFAVGAIVFVISLLLGAVPLVVPLHAEAKYIVAFAFVGAGIGFSIALNAAIDWWRGK